MSVQTEAQAVGSAPPPVKIIDPVEKFRRLLMVPSVAPLLLWMIVPLAMAIVMSFLRYNLLSGSAVVFSGFDNYLFLAGDASFIPAIINTIVFIGAVLIISVVAGVLLAVLYDQDFYGKNVAMLLVIAPFFVMPTVSALVWKNCIMHPVNGLISLRPSKIGLRTIRLVCRLPDGLDHHYRLLGMGSICVSDPCHLAEITRPGAKRSGCDRWRRAIEAVLVHHSSPPATAIGVVVMIETIFLLSIFAEIYITTAGGPGTPPPTLAFLVYSLGIATIRCRHRIRRRHSGSGACEHCQSSWFRCLLKISSKAADIDLKCYRHYLFSQFWAG